MLLKITVVGYGYTNTHPHDESAAQSSGWKRRADKPQAQEVR